MSKRSGTLVTINPDGSRSEQRLTKSPTLEQLQKQVGGYIERVRVRADGRVRDAYVNEDGLMQGLPINRHAGAMLAKPFVGLSIVGPLTYFVPDPKPKRESEVASREEHRGRYIDCGPGARDDN
jgi:hypothetical protein